MRKIWDIPGGVHPPESKTQSNQLPIGNISLPKTLVIPLGQHIGAEAVATVKIGDAVKKGQVIAEALGLMSAPVHASSSGTVVAIEERPIPHASGLNALCVVIETDGKDEWTNIESDENYLERDPQDLLLKLRNAGLAGMGGAGFPTAVKLSPHADHKIDTLILNGTECEPYITADDLLMRERADEIIAGALLFAHILGQPETLLIGIEDNKPEAIAAMQKAAEGTNVEIVSFPTKYPSGGEKQLIQILTGKEVPSGGIPSHLGIVVQNVGTAVAAYRAARFGEPLISRITTVVGESLGTQRNIEVLIGTPIDHVLNEHDFDPAQCARLIIGGPMMGYAMERNDIPVIKTTNCILVPSHQEMPEQPEAQPCIRCSMCVQACPANLLPQQLFWFAQAEEVDKLKAHNLFDCIECGACSYVCPSNIPLVQYYRASKGMIRQIDNDKKKSDQSRQRFEFRQERIAKAEAAKEAKRLARKKAAEEAKKNAAKQQEKPETAQQQPEAKVEAKATPERPKLERAVSSAQSRVERAQSKLEQEKTEGGDSARIESLEARLKEAQQKLAQAEAKLNEFDKGESSAAVANVQKKMQMSAGEKHEKTIATLKKRIATAEEKLAEAEQNQSPTVDALRQGVEKLQQKLRDAENEASAAESKEVSPKEAAAENNNEQSAADAAIAKAQAKAAALASMSEEEKAQAQRASLIERLEKAKARLAKAEAENSEHVEAFRNSVTKLEAKLNETAQ